MGPLEHFKFQGEQGFDPESPVRGRRGVARQFAAGMAGYREGSLLSYSRRQSTSDSSSLAHRRVARLGISWKNRRFRSSTCGSVCVPWFV